MTQHRVLSRDLALAVLLVGSLIAPRLVAREQPASSAAAPAVQPGRGAAQGPTVTSPEVRRDRRVTFRILAPAAQKVELRSPGDIPGVGGRGAALPQLTKNADGIWEATFGPLPAGAYRYVFVVDGLTVVDARNPATSQTNTTVYSLAVVPGSDLFDTKNVPHGAVAAVHYNSTALGGIRRMHIYTPPGYETSRDRYPVLYLLHGAGDVDDSWTSVGRAGFILDNLIAASSAKPMIVVMPAGHVNGAGAALGGSVPFAAAEGIPGIGSGPDPFANDFLTDLMPYVDVRSAVISTAAIVDELERRRAIASAVLTKARCHESRVVHFQGADEEGQCGRTLRPHRRADGGIQSQPRGPGALHQERRGHA